MWTGLHLTEITAHPQTLFPLSGINVCSSPLVQRLVARKIRQESILVDVFTTGGGFPVRSTFAPMGLLVGGRGDALAKV